MNRFNSFFKKPKDFVYITTLVALVIAQALLRKFVLAGFPPSSSQQLVSDLLFNFLLSVGLFGFYIKKYDPSILRKAVMGFFFLELILGSYMKRAALDFGNEIIFIGFIGILLTWLNTHLHRKKHPLDN